MEIQAAAPQGTPQQDQLPAVAAPASQPAPPLPAAPASGDDHRQPLTATVAKLFGTPGDQHSLAVQVSYRMEGRDVVTVFSDPKSGKEIAQFPSDVMIQIAAFFDKESGVAVDQSA